MNAKELYWPDLADRTETIRVINHAAGVCFVVGGGTAIIVALQMAGVFNLFPVGPETFIDSALFFLIGAGIFRKSRIAAIAGLLLYAFGQYMMIQAGGGHISFLMILFMLAFINGVRATMAYHEFGADEGSVSAIPLNQLNPLTGQPITGSVPVADAAAGDLPSVRRNPFRIIAAAVLLLAAAGGAAYAFLGRGGGQAPHVMIQASAPPPAADLKAETALAPSGNKSNSRIRTFKMKSGETISGKVVVEDSVYFTVETAIGQQKIVIREDMASEL